MTFQPKQSYSFDDLGIVPLTLSEIKSRNDVDTSTKFCGINLELPIASSPMSMATGTEMAIRLRELGCLGFLPRTDNIGNDLTKYRTIMLQNKEVFVSIPAIGDAERRFDMFYEEGAKYFCIDLANGFNKMVGDLVSKLKKKTKDCYIITGNVASINGYRYLADLGVDAVRCGIGNGSVCQTSSLTAIGVGQVSLIREIAQFKETNANYVADIICCGGIRGPADIVKAIALGADLCLSGKLFAACRESPGIVVKINGKLYKQYGGEASFMVKRTKEFVEGDDTVIPYTGSVERLLKSISDALRSAMSYLNCKTLKELKCLPDEYFVLLSNSAKIERMVHANIF